MHCSFTPQTSIISDLALVIKCHSELDASVKLYTGYGRFALGLKTALPKDKTRKSLCQVVLSDPISARQTENVSMSFSTTGLAPNA